MPSGYDVRRLLSWINGDTRQSNDSIARMLCNRNEHIVVAVPETVNFIVAIAQQAVVNSLCSCTHKIPRLRDTPFYPYFLKNLDRFVCVFCHSIRLQMLTISLFLFFYLYLSFRILYSIHRLITYFNFR